MPRKKVTTVRATRRRVEPHDKNVPSLPSVERMAYRVGADAAAALGMSPLTLRRCIDAGEIRAVTIHGSRYISVDEMRRVLSTDRRRRRSGEAGEK